MKLTNLKRATIGWLALAMIDLLPAGPTRAEDRSADRIVREADAEIGLNRRRRSTAEFDAGDRKTADLIAELAAAHPDDPRLSRLYIERW